MPPDPAGQAVWSVIVALCIIWLVGWIGLLTAALIVKSFGPLGLWGSSCLSSHWWCRAGASRIPATLTGNGRVGAGLEPAASGLAAPTRPGEPGRVIDADVDVDVFPADPAASLSAVAGDAVAGTSNTAELLDVDVEELAWPFAL